jgi:hypothetical protein
MIIVVDFDGTLHLGKWPDIGTPAPYCIEVMQKLKADGHYIIIWTCRENRQQTDMVNWLLEKRVPFDRINDNAPEQTSRFGNNSRKVNGSIYIDDKQVGGLPTWHGIYEYIQQKENEYQQLKNQ